MTGLSNTLGCSNLTAHFLANWLLCYYLDIILLYQYSWFYQAKLWDIDICLFSYWWGQNVHRISQTNQNVFCNTVTNLIFWMLWGKWLCGLGIQSAITSKTSGVSSKVYAPNTTMYGNWFLIKVSKSSCMDPEQTCDIDNLFRRIYGIA